MVTLGRLAIDGELWGMTVSGNVLTAAAGADGVWDVDIADPAAPRCTGRLRIDSPAWDVARLGGALCVARGADGMTLISAP